jgi:tetratricopeptide (TPR) repeat protein
MKKIALLITVALVCASVSLYAQTAQTRLDNGKRLFDQADYDGAILELSEAIRLDPNLAEAYAYRARAYVGDDNDLALADANRAIELNPRLALGYFARGNVYNNRNDYDRAIADYTEAIRLDPRNANAYSNRGVAYYNKKDYDRAIADYEAALRLDPNNSAARNNLAIANQEAEAQRRQSAAAEASRYDPAKFILVPNGFNPAGYTKADLFAAVAASERLQAYLNPGEYEEFDILGVYSRDFASDVVFVSQNGTDITFRTEDNAIRKSMKVDSRTGLTSGQKVRIYYRAYRIRDWRISAIERL